MRDPPSMEEFPEDQALVKTTALMMEGTTLIQARVAAITKGDCAAVPVDLRRLGSSDGTTRPIMKIVRTTNS